METILEKYNVTQERSAEIYEKLKEITDFGLEMPLDEGFEQICKECGVTKPNERRMMYFFVKKYYNELKEQLKQQMDNLLN
jgi:hypothetical protein